MGVLRMLKSCNEPNDPKFVSPDKYDKLHILAWRVEMVWYWIIDGDMDDLMASLAVEEEIYLHWK